MDRLTGIHAVREALEAGRPLDRVLVARGRHGERLDALVIHLESPSFSDVAVRGNVVEAGAQAGA